jgi:predicted nucleotide-binding protein (sugar kinase/HSP70/actin superfamily)
MAAAFRSIGVDAQPSPNSDDRTYELARQYLSGDECLPEAVTLGNFLKVTELPDYDPDKTAFMLPTSNGPCRYGHYLPLAKKVFHQIRGEDVLFAAPTSSDGYGGIGDEASNLVRTGWRAAVAADVIRKIMLLTRPYETEPGATDKVYWQSIEKISSVLEVRSVPHRQRMKNIINKMTEIRDDFRAVPVDKSLDKLIIGVVGEIFCRHNNFSNQDMFKLIEKHGGLVWVSDIAEWVMYTNDEEVWHLDRHGKNLSFQMFGSKLKQAVMAHDEHKIVNLFKDDFAGFEEPHHVRETLDLSVPYLPREGSRGEMVMSMGKALWYHKKGAAGVIDISPFTCMNGIITEAVYPRVSREHDNFPIRVFYFDGVHSNAEADLEIFMELARNYQKRHDKAKKSPE